MEKRTSRLRGCWLAVILAAVLVSVAAFGMAAPAYTEPLDLLTEIRGYIEAYYVKEVKTQDLPTSSPAAMVKGLKDPYSSYFDSAQYQRFIESLSGNFSGIGVQIEQKDNAILVVAPIKGTPADRAGLQPGDKILAVNGTSLAGGGTEQAVALIRGEPGTDVALTIQRGNLPPFEVKLIRENISMPSAAWEVLSGQVGYLHLATFGEDSVAEVQKGLQELEARHVKGIVLDLRDNPGGYLQTAVDLAGEFLPPGPVVQVVSRDGSEILSSRGEALAVPLVVLVNGSSASASEILAGAIRDYRQGSLVGLKTFGKGSVQTIFGLSDGGAVKITTAKYLTPSGQSLDGEGLHPDYVVAGDDAQLDYALKLAGGNVKRVITLAVGVPRAVVKDQEKELEAAPFIEHDRFYVPLRFVGENLGAVVKWDDTLGQANLRLGRTSVLARPGDSFITVDGVRRHFDAPVLLADGRVYLPARLIGQALGARVDWLDSLQMVRITQ